MGRVEQCGKKIYYTGEIAEKYGRSTSLNNIQGRITERCMNIIKNPKGTLMLDIGCGSGISTERMMDDGNFVIGIDISAEMLQLAQKRIERIAYGNRGADERSDLARIDIGEGLPFRSATFDHAVSVSVLQWLSAQNDAKKLLNAFFYTLYDVLKSDGLAVLQYYPESDKQMEQIMKSAQKNGFVGGTLVENEDSKKKKKTYLILEMAQSKGKSEHIAEKKKRIQKQVANRDLTRKEWIERKKEKRRAQGIDVPENSKYTGRKRRKRC